MKRDVVLNHVLNFYDFAGSRYPPPLEQRRSCEADPINVLLSAAFLFFDNQRLLLTAYQRVRTRVSASLETRVIMKPTPFLPCALLRLHDHAPRVLHALHAGRAIPRSSKAAKAGRKQRSE